MKKILLYLVFILVLLSPIFVFAQSMYSEIPKVLCEGGIELYKQGKYGEALSEFQKALLAEPGYRPALRYIRIIEQMGKVSSIEKPEEPVIPERLKTKRAASKEQVSETLDLFEIQREAIKDKKQNIPKISPPKDVKYEPQVFNPEIAPKKKFMPQALMLDENFDNVPQPINLDKGKAILIKGKNIKKFLVTNQAVLSVTRKGPDELLVECSDIGYTYLHIWDDNGRWTKEVLGVFPKQEGELDYANRLRKEQEEAKSFKMRYILDWTNNLTGRGMMDLSRSGSYLWGHTLITTGETPYGDLDNTVTIRKSSADTDMTYITLGLMNGKLGPFKGFAIRAGDYSPPFSNLEFPGETLRGGYIYSPAFNRKFEYTGFWGRESGGRSGNLAPDLYRTKQSYLNGGNFIFNPTQNQNYKFSILHGWGTQRESYLNEYGYDLESKISLGKLGLGAEVAYDTRKFAYLFNTSIVKPKFYFTSQLRDINRHFLSIIGNGARQGELGGLFNLNIKPTEKLDMSSKLDIYRDRLYPNPDDIYIWNENFDWGANYRIDPLTSLDFGYTLQNNLGKISQYRYQSPSMGISKTFKFLREIHTFARGSYLNNVNFSAHSLDYTDNKLYVGARVNLIYEWYYYVNNEWNWLRENFTGNRTQPSALEMGVDWGGQFWKSPFSGNLRFSYRDEEDATSPLSFLSGQDYIEGYSEVTYRHSPETEIYGSCRIRNTWANDNTIRKRIDANFNAGLRYGWDTGIRWNSSGDIEGYVFKDVNSDGLRQRDEPPIEGIKIWLGKDKSLTTDLFGYYKFKGVRGKRAYISLDMSSLPSGYLATVPANQVVEISNYQVSRVDFGIISRSEISGVLFEDVNDTGKFDTGDKGIENVVLSLENGQKTTTDNSGRYSFPNAAVGEHTLTLDLNTLPVKYLPKVAVTKQIALFDGITYLYNIPVKKVQK